MSAIYSILNKINGKIYVGLSEHPTNRKSDHFHKLRKNAHINPHLQKAWNKYGEDAFEFNILENCPKEDLGENEDWWIEYFDSTNRDKGYNIQKGGLSDYTVSEETRAKFIGENNPMYGMKGELSPRYGAEVSEETRQKLRDARLGTSKIDEYGGLWFIETMASTGITKNELGSYIGLSGDAIDSYLSVRDTCWSNISPNPCFKNNSKREILLDLGGLDFLKECIRRGMSQRQITSEFNLGTKGVIYRYLKSLDYSWASLVDEVNQ